MGFPRGDLLLIATFLRYCGGYKDWNMGTRIGIRMDIRTDIWMAWDWGRAQVRLSRLGIDMACCWVWGCGWGCVSTNMDALGWDKGLELE